MVAFEKIIKFCKLLRAVENLMSLGKQQIFCLAACFKISAFVQIGEWFASLKVQLRRRVKPKQKK